MPIRAEFRHHYRREWLTVTRPRILARARQQCERCKKPLHAWIFTYTWKTRDPQFSGVWRYQMILRMGRARAVVRRMNILRTIQRILRHATSPTPLAAP